jgi:RNA polymerase sigma factor
MLHRQSLDSRVIEERNDKQKASRLIFEFKPFIASVAQKKAGRFLEYGVDEELSIALSAFKEAMDSYDKKKGKFLSFAKLVINMRLIDYYRKKMREKTYSFSNSSISNGQFMNAGSLEQYEVDDEKEKRILEIIEYRAELEKWGIDLEELAAVSPKDDSLRKEYIEIARIIVKNNHILQTLMETRKLPLKEIEDITWVHRKKLERGRIYIIAMVLAIINDLSYVDTGGGDKK